MEIELKNVSCRDQTNRLDKISCRLKEKQIIGVSGKEKRLFLELLCGLVEHKGSILIEGKKRTEKNKWNYSCNMAYVPSECNFQGTVEEYFGTIICEKKCLVKNRDKKMSDGLKMVGLEEGYLMRQYTTLSKGEQKLIQIAGCLLSNPQFILLDDAMLPLDFRNQKLLWKLLKTLKEKYNKTIILALDDSNMLYQFTDYCLLLGSQTCIRQGRPNEIFQDVPFLLEQHLEIPDLVWFTYLAFTKKHVKLSYHKDIRDLIKDVYKHIDFTHQK